jgi:hypothetical protein
MQVKFVGARIEKTEQYNGKQYTVLAVPAVDAFSHPSKYRLQSLQQIGQIGTQVDVVANMQGIVRPKSYFDKQTGQQRHFDESSVMFDVVSFQPHQIPLPAHQNTSIPDSVKVAK